jgi:hypothetical protein
MNNFLAVLNQIYVVVYRLYLLKIVLTSSSEDGSAMAYCSCLKCMSKHYLLYPLRITTQSRHRCIHTNTTAHVRAYIHTHTHTHTHTHKHTYNTTNTNTPDFSYLYEAALGCRSPEPLHVTFICMYYYMLWHCITNVDNMNFHI